MTCPFPFSFGIPSSTHQPFPFAPAHALEQLEASSGPLHALVFLLGERERDRRSGDIGIGRLV